MLVTLNNFRLQVSWIAGLLVLGMCAASGAEPSPAGLWKTFDDKTHQPRGTIRIYEENGSLSGKIESSFTPAERTELCDKCSGDRKNEPIIGLVIMRGMKKHGDEYDGGNILDPETGSIYKCRLTVSPDGDKLFLRGYIGMSLFGRTQTWTRVSF